MKIGLVRHFPVHYKLNKIVDQSGFSSWIEDYDTKPILKPQDITVITEDWDICISSNLPRAIETTELIYKNCFERNHLLREVPFSVVPFNFSLPVVIWIIISRIGWWFGTKSQKEKRKKTLARCKELLKVVKKHDVNKNILIVSHGFYMRYLSKELKRNDFHGKMPMSPKGGVIYTFNSGTIN